MSTVAIPKNRAAGFTLVELITALTVISVAMGVLVSLFGNSISIARENRNNTIATGIAENQLNIICACPDNYTWQVDSPDVKGLFPVITSPPPQSTPSAFDAPDVTLASRTAQEQNSAVYRQFHWRAWGRSPSNTSNYVEVTVSVHWRSNGRPKILALTSTIPKSAIQGLIKAELPQGADS